MFFKRSLTILDDVPNSNLSPRVGHSLVALPGQSEQQFLLFGGASHEQGVQSDLWLIDMHTAKARPLPPSPSNWPQERYEHAAFLAYRQARPYMFLFGGSSSHGQLLNDLWQLDLETMRFELCTTRGQAPSPRTLHQGSCCLRNRTTSCDRFYVWGGGLLHHEPADSGIDGVPMYILDVGHSMVAVGHELYLYGGMDAEQRLLCDLWCYDGERNTWKQIKTKTTPPARSAHGLVALNERWLCLVAGMSCKHQELPLSHPSQEASVLNDVWMLDTQTLEPDWQKIEVDKDLIAAEPRLDFAVCCISVEDASVSSRLQNGKVANSGEGASADKNLVDKIVLSGGMDLSNVWQDWWIVDPWQGVVLKSLDQQMESSVAQNDQEREEAQRVMTDKNKC